MHDSHSQALGAANHIPHARRRIWPLPENACTGTLTEAVECWELLEG
jgi:hypothetical protein